MFSRLLWQSWKHGLRRKFLAVFTIFLAAGLISALLAVSIDIGDKMAHELKSYGANILIEPAGQAVLPDVIGNKNVPLNTQDFIDEKELPNIKDIFWRNNIVGFAPSLGAFVKATPLNSTQKVRDIRILGTFFDHHIPVPDEEDFHTGHKIISPFWKVTGEWVDDYDNQFGKWIPVLLGQQLANTTQWQQGDKILLFSPESQRNLQVEIKGIVETGGDEDNQILIPLRATQQLLNTPQKVQSVRVSALTVPENDLSRKARVNVEALDAGEYDRWYCTAYVSSISHQLEEAISGVVVNPIWQVAASEGVVISKIQLLLAVVTIAAVIAASMGIASLMTTGIIERSKEIGLMKALGAYEWQILLLFYSEAAISGIIGGLLGCIVGVGLAKFIGLTLFGQALSFAWIVTPSVIVLSVFISLLGTWFPAHRITRLYPIEVLYGR